MRKNLIPWKDLKEYKGKKAKSEFPTREVKATGACGRVWQEGKTSYGDLMGKGKKLDSLRSPRENVNNKQGNKRLQSICTSFSGRRMKFAFHGPQVSRLSQARSLGKKKVGEGKKACHAGDVRSDAKMLRLSWERRSQGREERTSAKVGGGGSREKIVWWHDDRRDASIGGGEEGGTLETLKGETRESDNPAPPFAGEKRAGG